MASREERLNRALQIAVETLAFYMSPDTYHAIAFIPDPPCGEFMDDFKKVDGRARPGKRARLAFRKIARIMQVKIEE